MIDMKCTGAGETILRLRNIGERVKENARKTMHRNADKIVQRAKEYAPVDEHNLEKAIEKTVGYEGLRGRLTIDIDIKHNVGGKDISVYGVIMHEGNYKLGPGSIAKQAATGKTVGPGFIQRAFDDYSDKLIPQLIDAVEEETK